MEPIISSIQQIGIGNPYVHEAWKWYRQVFGMDTKIFEEAAEANLMLPYTGGVPQKRHAILAVNMNGGGGMEIWQYTSRRPVSPDFEIRYGDLGIYACKIKSRDIHASFAHIKSKGADMLGEITENPAGQKHFFLKDLYGNIFEVIEADNWFGKTNHSTGGVYGAMFGVSDIEKSLVLYRDLLGFDTVIYDSKGNFDDTAVLPGGDCISRRVLLGHSAPRRGPFAPLLGSNTIELVQTEGRAPRKIFENRFWGDMGFIHLCFDVVGMEALGKRCSEKGFPFTVDSGAFNMGEAAGHFTYIEDPDGALIEFVETHKVPILKKFGWYIHLKNRERGASLPNWMLKAMGLNRVRD